MSSSVVVVPLPGRSPGARIAAPYGFRLRFGAGRAWRGVGNALDRVGDAAYRRAEIGQVDHREQQARDPEDMQVSEKRDQAENGDDLELQLVRFVRHALGQAVQLPDRRRSRDRKSTRLNSSHMSISYAVFCLKKKNTEVDKATSQFV